MTSNSGKFDILLQGGHVIDPANEIDGPADVGIRDRKIAAVGPGLSSTNAEKIVDVTGLLVTPGLIDMHTQDGNSIGRSYRDAPEVDNFTRINEKLPIGKFVDVKIIEAFEYDVSAQSINYEPATV